MAEMRDAGKRWVNFDSVEAACGVKIVAPKLEATIAGTTLHLANTEGEIEHAEEAIREEWRAVFNAMPVMCSSCSEIFARQDFASHTASGPCRGAEEDRTGVVIKADTVGGLEALAFELHQRNIPVRQATVGPVNKKDILMAQSASDPLQKVILGFSTKANTSDVAQQLEGDDGDVKFISGPIIYHIMDAFEEWQEATKALIEEEQRESMVYPGKVLFLKDHTFRAKGPAIVGMRVLGGRIHVGQRLMKLDGTPVGQVKSLRTRASEDVKEAMQGDEIAVAVQGPTVGRHIEELDEFYVDVPERHVKRLKKVDLSPVEEEILEEIVSLHRKDNHFWGR
jgi:translation initiation factor 5B